MICSSEQCPVFIKVQLPLCYCSASILEAAAVNGEVGNNNKKLNWTNL